MAHKHKLLKSLGMLAATSMFCIALAPGQAEARGTYASNIPNAAAAGGQFGNGQSCGLCHVADGGSGPRNDFGKDVQSNLGGNGPDWSAIYSLDSDKDGATNGEELCDPMGVFKSGDAQPSCEFTDPSDPNSKPTPAVMDMGMNPVDMGPADMDSADMGTPVADMGTPVADMGTPAQDMGTPVTDMGGTPAADMGTTAGSDMGGTPAADMGSATPIPEEEDDEGCSQSGSGSPLGGGVTLLGLLGLFGVMRKRRK